MAKVWLNTWFSCALIILMSGSGRQSGRQSSGRGGGVGPGTTMMGVDRHGGGCLTTVRLRCHSILICTYTFLKTSAWDVVPETLQVGGVSSGVYT